MKMYHFRLMTSFVLAIFLMSISVVLIAWACDSLKHAIGDRERDLEDAEQRLKDVENKGYMGSISQGATYGMGVGFGYGVVTTAASGPFAPATAVPVIAKSTVLGGLGGAAWGGIAHRENLKAARNDVDYYKKKLAEAKQAYQDCLNPPAKYTYTDVSGYVWQFTIEAYGSDEAAYNAYMNFIASKGH